MATPGRLQKPTFLEEKEKKDENKVKSSQSVGKIQKPAFLEQPKQQEKKRQT